LDRLLSSLDDCFRRANRNALRLATDFGALGALLRVDYVQHVAFGDCIVDITFINAGAAADTVISDLHCHGKTSRKSGILQHGKKLSSLPGRIIINQTSSVKNMDHRTLILHRNSGQRAVQITGPNGTIRA
jgi:hypothetical protein